MASADEVLSEEEEKDDDDDDAVVDKVVLFFLDQFNRVLYLTFVDHHDDVNDEERPRRDFGERKNDAAALPEDGCIKDPATHNRHSAGDIGNFQKQQRLSLFFVLCITTIQLRSFHPQQQTYAYGVGW